jgi:predicted permease
MTSIRVAVSRLLELVLRRRRNARLAQEMQEHLDLLTQDHVARGLPLAEARLAARRDFGGVDQVAEICRERRSLPLVDTLAQDVRFALRLFARHKGFAATVVLVLGLGIGVNNMLFTIVNAHTLRGLPLDQPDRIAFISTFDDRQPDRGVTPADFEAFRTSARAFAGLAAFTTEPAILGDEGRRAPERLTATYTTANAFTVLGIRPALGRTFEAEDDRPGAARVAALGRATWEARYAGDEGIVGRSILVNGTPTLVVGVLPDRSGFPSTADIWLPLAGHPADAAAAARNQLGVFGRLRDGVALDAARQEMEALAARLPSANASARQRVRVVPINERYLGRLTEPAWLAFLTVGFLVLLISCANVANLLLNGSVLRVHEIAMRSSLGASRWRIARQLLIEACVLSVAGGTAGLAFATVGLRLFRSLIPDAALPYWYDYTVDMRVLAALILVSAATVVVCGLVPAVSASRTDVNRTLKDSGLSATERRASGRWTTAFLTGQLALTVLMLANVVVGLRVSRPDPPAEVAIDTPEVLTAAITLPDARYPSPAHRRAFYQLLEERLRAIPGVTHVSATTALPFHNVPNRRLSIAGRADSAETPPMAAVVDVAPHLFATFGLTMRSGREHSSTASTGEVVISERLAELYFAGEDPIGRRIAVTAPDAAPGESDWLEIVGVAPLVRQRPIVPADPVAYLSYLATPASNFTLVVRSTIDATSLASRLREEVATIDAHLPLYRVRTMARAIDEARWNGRVSGTLLNALVAISVLLATVGLYAVTAHAVAHRTREIAVRVAFGAGSRDVFRLVLTRALAQVALGFTLGVVAALGWSRLFPSGRTGVSVADPGTLAIVGLLLVAVTIVAIAVPSIRATRLDPLVALRR